MKNEEIRTILRKVREIEIRTRKLVTDSMAGAYHSSFKGQGMDFEEVREYTPGDDVRSIDWNVTARMDHPYVKQFREERELSLLLLVDISASGQYGSTQQTKRELAAEVASVLAFSAVRNNDKVGVLLFSTHAEQFIPPKKGRAHILRVIREILFHVPEEKGTNILESLTFLNRAQKRKCLCFLISDFYQGPNGILPTPQEQAHLFQSLAVTNKRHDLLLLKIEDPAEHVIPIPGIYHFEDAETGTLVTCDLRNRKKCQQYAEEKKSQKKAFLHNIRQRGIEILPLQTGEPYIRVLQRMFEKRASRP